MSEPRPSRTQGVPPDSRCATQRENCQGGKLGQGAAVVGTFLATAVKSFAAAVGIILAVGVAVCVRVPVRIAKAVGFSMAIRFSVAIGISMTV